jgi:hypothetical protein
MKVKGVYFFVKQNDSDEVQKEERETNDIESGDQT